MQIRSILNSSAATISTSNLTRPMMKFFVALLAVFVGVSQAVEDCGRTPIPPNLGRSRIVNGEEAVPYSWPWQVALCIKPSQRRCQLGCGGSLINRQWVITAGHCAPTTSNSNRVVKIGVFNIHKIIQTGVITAEVEKQIRHPKYNTPKELGHDVALLKLKKPIEYNDHVQPICLATNDDDLKENDTMYTTGWGSLGGGGPSPSKLQQVALPWLSRKTCGKLDLPHVFDETKVCAGGQSSNQGACFGDSGGPLVRQNSDKRWILYGISSYVSTSNCVGEGYPTWYGRMSAFCQWVNETVGETVCGKAV